MTDKMVLVVVMSVRIVGVRIIFVVVVGDFFNGVGCGGRQCRGSYCGCGCG